MLSPLSFRTWLFLPRLVLRRFFPVALGLLVSTSVHAGEAPAIQIYRGAIELTAGSSTSLSAHVTGTGPLTYQWFKDGQALPDETLASLHLIAANDGSAGSYRFTVTNAFGTTTSDPLVVKITPQPVPAFIVDGDGHYPTPPWGIASITPQLVPQTYGQLEFQWLYEGQPIAGETDQTLYLDQRGGGNYQLRATNTAGSATSQVVQVRIVSSDHPTGSMWSKTSRDSTHIYFLFWDNARIARFNLATGSFEPALVLTGPASAFAIYEGKIYYAFDSAVRRMNPDGSSDEAVGTAAASVASFYGVGDNLYAVSRYSITGFHLPDFSSFSPQGGFFSTNLDQGFSVSPTLRRVFARSLSVSPADISYATFDENGSYANVRQSPYHGDFPWANRTWVLPGEELVAEETGTVYKTADLTFAGSIAHFVDLTPLAEGDFVVLRGFSLTRIAPDLHDISQLPLLRAADAVASSGNRIFVFRTPEAPDGNPAVAEYSLTDFSAPLPAAYQPPITTAFAPDTVLQDQRGDLLIYNANDQTVYRWSPQSRGFTGYIPLLGSPTHLTYSAAWDRLLLGYADGKITSIDLGARHPSEQWFTRAPVEIHGLIATGEFLTLVDPSGAWEALYTYDQDGKMLHRREWSYVFRNAIWNPTNRRLMQADDNLRSIGLSTTGTYDTWYVGARQTPSVYHHSALVLAPSGDQILAGTGEFFNTVSLERTNALPTDFESGIWSGNRLFTAKTGDAGVTVTRWGGSNYGADATARFHGNAPHLFAGPDEELIVTTQDLGRLVVSVFDRDLQLLSRRTHLGAELANTTARLTNLSTRVRIPDTGGAQLTAGFVIGGTQPLAVLIRAVGPALDGFGLHDFLQNPTLELYNAASELIGTNADWDSGSDSPLPTIFHRVGAFSLPTDSHDAAMLATLSPGAYSVHVVRGDQPGGVVLLELYDASATAGDGHLVNLSTMMKAGTGDDTLIAGFAVSGDSRLPMLVRTAGPSLARFGVQDWLTDPRLTVRRGSRVLVKNDNWAGTTTMTETSHRVGAFDFTAPNSLDAAAFIELPPGAYTTEVNGASTTDTGNAIIEVYEVRN